MSQFRVLYQQFLFRIVDLELLSADAQGDAGRLLGQFAALLMFFSALLGLGVLTLNPRAISSVEHFLIATTMLAVGLFAVLRWDSTFPDRLDVLALGALPVRARTLFLAKVAASGAALAVTVAALNSVTGLALPFALVADNSTSIFDLLLSRDLYLALAAYWITMLAAGGFIFCSVLCLQGIATQLLPRRQFLTVSTFLQMAVFCLIVSVYFLQPPLAAPQALVAVENQRLLAWLPSYWFLGLFLELNGFCHPGLALLALRGLGGLAIAASGAGATFLVSYFSTLRKIADEPDIAPGFRSGNWLPGFGNSLQTAVVRFSIRTLFRSRRHRVIVAFYLGVAFAIVAFYMKSPLAQKQLLAGPSLNAPLLASNVTMMIAWVVGVRVVFSMPAELRANWIFRVTPVRGGRKLWAANRRALMALAVMPVWAGSAILLPVAGHQIVLGLLGMILADLSLARFQKIPFTCSYLPGKSRIHLAVLAGVFLTLIVDKAVGIELRALADPAGCARMFGLLVVAAIGARWWATMSDSILKFEDTPPPVICALDLRHERALMR